MTRALVDGVTTDEVIGIYERFCDAELQNDLTARRDLHGNDAHDHDLASNTLLEELMADPANLYSIRCETDRGVAAFPHEVLRAALAGHLRRVVLDSKGHIVDYGRKKRMFEGPARNAAKVLVRRCQHPICDLPAGWSDIDHNIEWTDTGGTDQSNAGVLCSGHNNAKHRLELQRRRAANGIDHMITPDGTIILPVGARTPQFDRDDDPPDDPDEIKRETNIAREHLRAAWADWAVRKRAGGAPVGMLRGTVKHPPLRSPA